MKLQPLRKNSNEKTAVFSLPAGTTCGSCEFKRNKTCYAMRGYYNFRNVKEALQRNFEATKNAPEFVVDMNYAIRRTRRKTVRVHSSGDFYSKDYILNWFKLARLNPEKTFYAYTKRVRWFKELAYLKPANFIVVFSVGSAEDKHIDMSADRHARVFKSEAELNEAGYINVMNDDSLAWRSNNHKIGLVIH